MSGSKSSILSFLIVRIEWQNSLKLTFFLLVFISCLSNFQKKNLLTDELLPDANPLTKISIEGLNWNLLSFKVRDPRQISAIILHSMEKKNPDEYLKLSFQNKFMIHVLVDKSGIVYSAPDFLKRSFTAAPGIDEESIHIAYEGSEESLLANQTQYKKLVRLIDELTNDINILKSNRNIISKKGIFTHNQAKRRFGGFVDFSSCGGEKVMEKLLRDIHGEFYDEDHWADRYESGWVLKKENKQKLQEDFNPTNGRGITKPNKSKILNLEKDANEFPIEAYRARYTHRGKINPTCIVLHYTAIPDYMKSLKTLESRNLTASIMVDKDGKAYQLVDLLEDRAAAATGTNDNCIQIEIIALDTKELLAQPIQIEKVKSLVEELSMVYKIKTTNHDVTSFAGVFSHTQAKKKWGGSIFLNAKDFDPGEEYMELIIKSIGGKYFPEPEWKDRDSAEWAILYRNFQP